jgi:hypothetical protein
MSRGMAGTAGFSTPSQQQDTRARRRPRFGGQSSALYGLTERGGNGGRLLSDKTRTADGAYENPAAVLGRDQVGERHRMARSPCTPSYISREQRGTNFQYMSPCDDEKEELDQK